MKIPLLNAGYVEFIEAYGHGRSLEGLLKDPHHDDFEKGIIEAARQSTQGSFRGWDTDAKLLAHLYSHSHTTPFEFAGMIIEVQAPIFVFREWHRHRTQSYNEMSARYSPLPDLHYVPDRDNVIRRIADAKTTSNKQAGGLNHLINHLTSDLIAAGQSATEWLDQLQHVYREAEITYRAALDSGIPKELARLSMPLGHYSRMRASANLRNWLAFMTLRCDPAAQWEIRMYALAVAQIIETTFPRTFELWTNGFQKIPPTETTATPNTQSQQPQ